MKAKFPYKTKNVDISTAGIKLKIRGKWVDFGKTMKLEYPATGGCWSSFNTVKGLLNSVTARQLGPYMGKHEEYQWGDLFRIDVENLATQKEGDI